MMVYNIMTMLEDDICTTCSGNKIHKCNSEGAQIKAYGLSDCPYCGKPQVNLKHLCHPKIAHLTHVCLNCGAVSDNPAHLCHPVPIEDAQKAEWLKIEPREQGVLICRNCEQPVQKPGHICDPLVPYTCKYCGEEVTKTHHMCKGIIGKSKYMCKLCGRLAVEKIDVCVPIELDK